MKKLFVLLVIVGASLNAFSQAEVSIGPKAGANLSKFDDPDAENLTSFHVGAFTLFKFTKIGIQPELLFSQQGSSFNAGDLKTSYMTIPVMLKLYLIGGFNIQAGPQFGFLTAAEFDGSDIKDSMKSSDITGNVGLGIDLPLGITFDARYNIGFSDVADNPTYPELKSRVIQLSIGYKLFKLGN